MFQVLQRSDVHGRMVLLGEYDSIREVLTEHQYTDFSATNSKEDRTLVVSTFVNFHYRLFSTSSLKYKKVCYNIKGKLIPYTEIEGTYNAVLNEWRINRQRRRFQRRKCSRSGWRRHVPRTHQERKHSYAVDKEIKEYYNVKIRPRRNGKNLPTDWDSHWNKSGSGWKNNRKYQWREK